VGFAKYAPVTKYRRDTPSAPIDARNDRREIAPNKTC
jgi:hypothetical protein